MLTTEKFKCAIFACTVIGNKPTQLQPIIREKIVINIHRYRLSEEAMWLSLCQSNTREDEAA